jgi:activator of HSP90 ATPase
VAKKAQNFDTSLAFTAEVTRRHGEIFAKVFLAISIRTEAPGDAFELTGVMEWPDDDEDETPAKMRHERIEDEILRRTFDEIEGPLREAFVRIAENVIRRERVKDRKL